MPSEAGPRQRVSHRIRSFQHMSAQNCRQSPPVAGLKRYQHRFMIGDCPQPICLCLTDGVPDVSDPQLKVAIEIGQRLIARGIKDREMDGAVMAGIFQCSKLSKSHFH